MNILFLHRSFPAQFKYIASELAKNSENRVIFLTNTKEIEIEGVEKVIYEPDNSSYSISSEYLLGFDSAFSHAKAVLEEVLILKEKGFIPDIIYAHSGWGPAMFMKDVFPNVPLICYFEWFQNAQGADTGFGGVEISDNQKAGLRFSNAQVLMDLNSCDAGLSPTKWQKAQFPKEYHSKIKVIHDGIDTEFFKPDADAKFLINENNLTLTKSDEVITYGTRGMEPYRGFPQFMEGIEKVLKARPNVHAVIAGEDRVCYRGRLEQGTYKELMLKNLDLDMNRVHFVGALPYSEYIKLLQISSVHVYLTVPYVLSWSVLEAMSCGCCLVSSNTQPVQEVIKNYYNGLLVDFWDVNKLAEKINYALDHQDKMTEVRKNARKTVIENYDLKKLLPEHIAYISSYICK